MTGATTSESRAGRSGAGVGEGASSPISFTMPVPPSVNGIFRNARGRGRVKTKDYIDWRAYAATSIRLQRVGRVRGHVVVVFGVERASLTADIDNRVKAMLDAMVDAGVIDDDRFVTALAVAWLPAANGLAHVQVLPAERLELQFLPSKDGATGGWYHTAPQQLEEVA